MSFRPTYAQQWGTNRAVIPWDHTTGRIWHERASFTMTGSGISLITGAPCESLGVGRSFKWNSTASQNVTVCSEASGDGYFASGVPASPASILIYSASSVCSGANAVQNYDWWLWRINCEGADARDVYCAITTDLSITPKTHATIFLGKVETEKLYFPLTFNNLFTSSSAVEVEWEADFGVFNPLYPGISQVFSKTRGFNGSITVSISGCGC